MGMRIHEVRQKYNLTSIQMNELLSNLGYTGSTNAFAGLSDDILAKIETHFANKSVSSEELKTLLTEIEEILEKNYGATGNDFISKVSSVKDILIEITPSLDYLMSNHIDHGLYSKWDYIYTALIKIYNEYSQKNIKEVCKDSDFIYELKLIKYFLSSEKLELEDYFFNKQKWQNKSVFIKLSTSNEYGKDFLCFLSKNKTKIFYGNDQIEFDLSDSKFDLSKFRETLNELKNYTNVDNVGLVLFCDVIRCAEKSENYYLKVKSIMESNSISIYSLFNQFTMRIYEVGKKYNLSRKQMNDLLANLGYTGNKCSLSKLPGDIVEKIKKYFANKNVEDLNNQPQTVQNSTQLCTEIRNNKFSKYDIGDIINGKVKKIFEYGVLVELEEGVKGLLHNSNISSHSKENLEEGQIVKVQIIKINSEHHKLSLKEITDLKEPSNLDDCSTNQENIVKQTFVLDTNIILDYHKIMFSFQGHDVVIPESVIKELDNFKKYGDKRGYEARQASRDLFNLRKKGNLSEGVKLKIGGILQIMNDSKYKMPTGLKPNKVDDCIIACALKLKGDGKHPFLVSNDKNLCIRAEAYGIKAESYETNEINLENHSTLIELNEKGSNNNYSKNKLKHDFSEYEEIELVDYLIDCIKLLNKKILIKNIPIKNLFRFSLSNKYFGIFHNADRIYCSFESLDRERIIELKEIFENRFRNYNIFLNIYCVVQEGVFTQKGVSQDIIFLKLDNFAINPK